MESSSCCSAILASARAVYSRSSTALAARGRGAARTRCRGREVRPLGVARRVRGGRPITVQGERDRSSGLFETVAEWLSPARRSRPVVALDDVQWIDEATAALFHYIARSRPTGITALACAARPGDLADNPAALRLVRSLTREGGSIRSGCRLSTLVRPRRLPSRTHLRSTLRVCSRRAAGIRCSRSRSPGRSHAVIPSGAHSTRSSSTVSS